MHGLRARLDQLYRDLGRLSGGFEPYDFAEDDEDDMPEPQSRTVSPPLLELYNVLLEQAQRTEPEDALLTSLRPLREPLIAGELRTLVAQVRRALD